MKNAIYSKKKNKIKKYKKKNLLNYKTFDDLHISPAR